MTQASTYSASHRCLKRHNLKLVRGVPLCAHHRAMRSPRLAVAPRGGKS